MKPCLALNSLGTELQIPLQLSKGPVATLHKCLIAFQTELGKWLDDDLFGMDWQHLTSKRNVEIESKTRSLIAAVDGVIRVESVVVNNANGNCSITCIAIFQGLTEIRIQFGVLSEAGQYPMAWYNSLGLNFASMC